MSFRTRRTRRSLCFPARSTRPLSNWQILRLKSKVPHRNRALELPAVQQGLAICSLFFFRGKEFCERHVSGNRQRAKYISRADLLQANATSTRSSSGYSVCIFTFEIVIFGTSDSTMPQRCLNEQKETGSGHCHGSFRRRWLDCWPWNLARIELCRTL